VVDPEDDDGLALLIDFVDDAIVATPRCPTPGEFTLQRMANAAWVVDQWTQHELDDSGCDLLWESVELSFC
jgi:hypothetical protein